MDGAVPITSPKELLANASVEIERTSTRGDGKVELGESFSKNAIDFGSSLDHLKIHHDGEVAGSQFNGGLFDDPRAVQEFIISHLPEELQYDQHNRAEITLDVEVPSTEPIGYSGVMPLDEIQKRFPEAKVAKEMRMPGGIEETEDGIEGAWYPEMAFDPEEGKMKVVMEDDQPKNTKGKFEPKANIVTVPAEKFKDVSAINKLTLIIQKDRNTGSPVILTMFPGENAPAFPAIINSEDYKSDTTKNPSQTEFWNNNAFIKTE